MSSRRINIYVGVLLLLAVGAGLVGLAGADVSDPWALAALLALTLVLSNMAIELPFAVSLSLTFAPIFAGILQAGPLGGAILGVAAAVSLQEIREHKPLVLILGNVSQLFLAGLLAGWVYVALGGSMMQTGQLLSPSLRQGLLAPVLAVLVFFVVNLLLVGMSVVLRSGAGPREALRILNPGSYWISLLVLALLGYVMAYLIGISSWIGVLLLVLPFLAARRTFRVYVELSEAYVSTVRSLVTAIEAKDPYTRGHSERVAVYARQLGERLALPRADMDLLERAALLHDVGKIGIELDTLTSPAQLAAEEVRAIRQHPVIGSELVGDVEFLADAVPIVRHHHERFDGAGYPDGLIGEEIPPLARLMAVVDSYDAMTSDRAYRTRMTEEQALVEIARVAGTQLDGDMARSFSEMIREARGRGRAG